MTGLGLDIDVIDSSYEKKSKTNDTRKNLSINPEPLDFKFTPILLRTIQERTIKAFLDIHILLALQADSNISGYDIIGHFTKTTGFVFSPGTIYATLYSMEREGLITGHLAKRKRTYELTEKGTKTAKAIIEHSDEIVDVLKTILTK